MYYYHDNYSVSNMFNMFVLDFLIYLFLGFYLENVLPQEFGTPKPFYFLFTKQFWCGEEVSDEVVNKDLANQSNKLIILLE